jgi:hypothetical protein
MNRDFEMVSLSGCERSNCLEDDCWCLEVENVDVPDMDAEERSRVCSVGRG